MKWNQRLVRFSFDDGPPAGRAGAWDAAVAYWESRGFRCAPAGEGRVVGRRGVIETLMPDMSTEEREALERSAGSLRQALDRAA